MGISTVLINGAVKGAKYTKRALNLVPEAAFGDSTMAMGKAVKATKGSIFKKGKAGILALEKEVAAKKAAQGGFLKRLWHNTTHFAQDIFYHEPKNARYAAMRKVVSKKDIVSKLAAIHKTTEKDIVKKYVTKATVRGFGKGFMKKIPFIGQVLTIALEAPNIYNAAKDEGFGTALKETAWAAAEIGGLAAGTVIGTIICPGFGTLLGGIIGSLAVASLRGKNYTDKKDALKEMGLTEEDISQYQQQGGKIDDIFKELEAQEKENLNTTENSQEENVDNNQQTPQGNTEQITEEPQAEQNNTAIPQTDSNNTENSDAVQSEDSTQSEDVAQNINSTNDEDAPQVEQQSQPETASQGTETARQNSSNPFVWNYGTPSVNSFETAYNPFAFTPSFGNYDFGGFNSYAMNPVTSYYTPFYGGFGNCFAPAMFLNSYATGTFPQAFGGYCCYNPYFYPMFGIL